MTRTNLQFADHICKRMLISGMIRSQAEFSERWLNQSASYLSSSKTRHRNMPDTLIRGLFERLDLHVQTCRNQMTNANDAHWREAYKRAFPIHAEVQGFLTWRASGQAVARLSPAQITSLVQRIGQSAAQLHAKRQSALAKIIEFATLRKQS
jgi:hypothetical protein